MHPNINNIVASVFCVDAAGIASRSKARMYSDPRKVAYFLEWKFNQATLEQIKRRYDRRAHSGIIGMIQQYWNRRETDPQFTNLSDECIQRFEQANN
jgi:chromosomal replication initiation ATPase DnaA